MIGPSHGDLPAAWEALFRVLPAGWAVARPAWRADDGIWFVHARHLTGLRGPREVREAWGDSEAAALLALVGEFQRERSRLPIPRAAQVGQVADAPADAGGSAAT